MNEESRRVVSTGEFWKNSWWDFQSTLP